MQKFVSDDHQRSIRDDFGDIDVVVVGGKEWDLVGCHECDHHLRHCH